MHPAGRRPLPSCRERTAPPLLLVWDPPGPASSALRWGPCRQPWPFILSSLVAVRRADPRAVFGQREARALPLAENAPTRGSIQVRGTLDLSSDNPHGFGGHFEHARVQHS